MNRRNRVGPRIDILTIFPKMFGGVFSESLIGKARQKGLVDIRVHDIRRFSNDNHRTVDDRPYGGGPGMLMKAEPLYNALKFVGAAGSRKNSGACVVYMSPQGRPLTQPLARALSRKKHLVLLAGRYEGIDERLFKWIDGEVSVGDVVYTGGEIPAMAVADAVTRLIPGVVQDPDSLRWDSFADGWNGRLDCPHYTRPEAWRGQSVPKILLSGNHQEVARWREQKSRQVSRQKRPDLFSTHRARYDKTAERFQKP